MLNGTGIIEGRRRNIMNKTRKAIIAGLILMVIVGCIAADVF